MGNPDDRRMTFLFACFKLGAAIILARYAYQYYYDDPLNPPDEENDADGKKNRDRTKQPEEEPSADTRTRMTVDNRPRTPAVEQGNQSSLLSGHSQQQQQRSQQHSSGASSMMLNASTVSSFETPRIAASGGSAGAGSFPTPNTANYRTPQQDQLEAMRRSIELGLGSSGKGSGSTVSPEKPADNALFFNLLGLYQGIKK